MELKGLPNPPSNESDPSTSHPCDMALVGPSVLSAESGLVSQAKVLVLWG